MSLIFLKLFGNKTLVNLGSMNGSQLSVLLVELFHSRKMCSSYRVIFYLLVSRLSSKEFDFAPA